MNTHISSFNREVRSILKNGPSNTTYSFIDKYYSNNRHPDYYTALVSLTNEIGLGFGNEPLENDKGKPTYLPFLKFYPKNIFDMETGTEEIVSRSTPFTKLNKAYTAMAKAYVYRLSELRVEKVYRK